MEKDKDPSQMSVVEIREEIEVCFETLNAIEKLRDLKARIGSDIDRGILNRVEQLNEELTKRKKL